MLGSPCALGCKWKEQTRGDGVGWSRKHALVKEAPPHGKGPPSKASPKVKGKELVHGKVELHANYHHTFHTIILLSSMSFDLY